MSYRKKVLAAVFASTCAKNLAEKPLLDTLKIGAGDISEGTL
jgi:hypothetical protein